MYEQSDNQHPFAKGIQGAPGVSFHLTSDGNYDMVKKKTNKCCLWTDPNDAVKKSNLIVPVEEVAVSLYTLIWKIMLTFWTTKLERTFSQLKADDESLVRSKRKLNFVGIREAEPVQLHLDMGNSFIYNVKTPTAND